MKIDWVAVFKNSFIENGLWKTFLILFIIAVILTFITAKINKKVNNFIKSKKQKNKYK